MFKLSDEQVKYMKTFQGLKSFARQEELNRVFGPAKNKEIEESLVKAGVLKRDKRGSLRGPSYYEITTMIRLSTLTLEEMLAERQRTSQQITALETEIKTLRETDPNFCFYEREKHDSLRYYRENLDRWDNDIKLKQRQSA